MVFTDLRVFTSRDMLLGYFLWSRSMGGDIFILAVDFGIFGYHLTILESFQQFRRFQQIIQFKQCNIEPIKQFGIFRYHGTISSHFSYFTNFSKLSKLSNFSKLSDFSKLSHFSRLSWFCSLSNFSKLSNFCFSFLTKCSSRLTRLVTGRL